MVRKLTDKYMMKADTGGRNHVKRETQRAANLSSYLHEVLSIIVERRQSRCGDVHCVHPNKASIRIYSVIESSSKASLLLAHQHRDPIGCWQVFLLDAMKCEEWP